VTTRDEAMAHVKAFVMRTPDAPKLIEERALRLACEPKETADSALRAMCLELWNLFHEQESPLSETIKGGVLLAFSDLIRERAAQMGSNGRGTA
jgi:hypothetical protein